MLSIMFAINFYYFYGFYYIYGGYSCQITAPCSTRTTTTAATTTTMILYLESDPAGRVSLYVDITALYLHTEIVCYSALKNIRTISISIVPATTAIGEYFEL